MRSLRRYDPGRRKRAGAFVQPVSGSTPGRSDSLKRRFLASGWGGATRLRSWLPGAGVGYLDFSSGWFFDLAGTVDLSVGALSARPDRVRPVIQFPGT